jgi:hypothetical protein
MMALRIFCNESGYPATQWTVPRLREHLAHRTGQRRSDDTVRPELRRLGYTWKRSRYLALHRPDEPGAKDDAPDGKARALQAASGGRIGSILVAWQAVQ